MKSSDIGENILCSHRELCIVYPPDKKKYSDPDPISPKRPLIQTLVSTASHTPWTDKCILSSFTAINFTNGSFYSWTIQLHYYTLSTEWEIGGFLFNIFADFLPVKIYTFVVYYGLVSAISFTNGSFYSWTIHTTSLQHLTYFENEM